MDYHDRPLQPFLINPPNTRKRRKSSAASLTEKLPIDLETMTVDKDRISEESVKSINMATGGSTDRNSPIPISTSSSTATLSAGQKRTLENSNSQDSLSISEEPENQEAIKIDNFLNWIYCICVVTFDLELGQKLETIYPNDQILTDRDKSNICYLSFPDSNTGSTGDSSYMFRLRQDSSFFDNYNNKYDYNYSRDIPNIYEKDCTHFYGFTYFRQVRDMKQKRGYMQKSVVIITRNPYSSFYQNTLEVIALNYFTIGEEALLQAAHDINSWPRPMPGESYKLPLYNYFLRTRIPLNDEDAKLNTVNFSNFLYEEINSQSPSPGANGNSTNHGHAEPFTMISIDKSDQNVSSTLANSLNSPLARSLSNNSDHGSSDNIIIPNLSEIGIWTNLKNQTSFLQVLWELILLNEPLVVIANSPKESSEAVQALISLISPLKYHAEYRPYFTIHDSEYNEFTGKEILPPPSCILGVTNPFFVKQLPHWPHILKLDSNNLSEKSNNLSINKTRNLDKLNADIDAKPGLYSNFKPCLVTNVSTLTEVNSSSSLKSRRPVQVKDAVYSRFFRDLTTSFMHPLERYLFTLMPLLKNISPFKKPPNLKKFNSKEFLASLEGGNKGPQLTTPIKGNWINLYRNFIRSPNFHGWLESRQSDMKNRISKLHFISMSIINPGNMEWLKKSVVEQVDHILKFKEVVKKLEIALEFDLNDSKGIVWGTAKSIDFTSSTSNTTRSSISDIQVDSIGIRFLKVVKDNKERREIVAKMNNVIDSLIMNLPEDTKDLVRNANC